MGIGAAIGVGASGAGLGAAVGGPVGAAVGGVVGLLVGMFAGGGDDNAAGTGAASPGKAADLVSSVSPIETGGVPVRDGPYGGGPLAPFVPTSPPSSAPIETKPDPMTIGGAPATDVNAVAANLNEARGGFPVGSSLSKPAWTQNAASDTMKARVQQQKDLKLARGGNTASPGSTASGASAPVETLRGSEIPTAAPTVPMMDTSKGALESAVKQSFAARTANLTSARVLSAAAAGPKPTARTNAGAGHTPGPPVSPAAQGTAAAPVEALEDVQAAGKQLAKSTTDRFAGMGARGRNNVAFRTKK